MKVIYWSGTGNTEAMAEAVGKGIQAAGQEAELLTVSNTSVEVLKEENVLHLDVRLWAVKY